VHQDPLSIAALISGGGTTLKNLIDRIADGRLDATISLVISSNPAAKGLRFAEEAGIPTHVFERRAHSSDDDYSYAIFSVCRNANVDLVVMGGFLKFLPIAPDFDNRVMNIHPALIPNFCGKGMYGDRVHAAVLESGVGETGCSVHFVDNQYDHGPIILQRTVPVEPGDTVETLQRRVFAAECEAYPEAIALFASGRLRVVDGKVAFADG